MGPSGNRSFYRRLSVTLAKAGVLIGLPAISYRPNFCQRATIGQPSGSSLNAATTPYDQWHTYWNASVGGKDPASANRSYVKDGRNAREDPFRNELREWVFGSEDILRRMVTLAEGVSGHRYALTSRRLRRVSA